ncbi:MAG: hypothetical protein R3B70_45655 [Polyangiaceae bacterium]
MPVLAPAPVLPPVPPAPPGSVLEEVVPPVPVGSVAVELCWPTSQPRTERGRSSARESGSREEDMITRRWMEEP